MTKHADRHARAYLSMHYLSFMLGHLGRTAPDELKDVGLERCSCCGGALRATEQPPRIDISWDGSSPHFDVFPVCPDCHPLTREQVVQTAATRVEIELDRVAAFGAEDPHAVERWVLREAGKRSFVRRPVLQDFEPGRYPTGDLSQLAVYVRVEGSELHKRPLLAPFPWRDGEFFCVGDAVEEALRIERGLADGTVVCMSTPAGNQLIVGGAR